MITALFSQLLRWWWATIIVIAGILLLITLGNWQLDRLDQRRARVALTQSQLALPPLQLNEAELPADLTTLKIRYISATGSYDYSRQILLMHQNKNMQPGGHLLTPLLFPDGQTAVLVDRGWIPAIAADNPDAWSQYDGVAGSTTIVGYAALTQKIRGKENEIPPEAKQSWYRVNLEGIDAQLPYTLLPVYIQQKPANETAPPFPLDQEFDFSDGNHLSYAYQWYGFAVTLIIAYLAYGYKTVAAESKRSDSD